MKISNTGFSKADLIALIFLAILSFSILLPVLGVDNQKSNLAGCQKNLRLIWDGLELYCEDNNDIFPPAMVGRTETYAQGNIMYYLWSNYVENIETFHCPADVAFWNASTLRQSYSYWFDYGVYNAEIHQPIYMPLWGRALKLKDLSKALIMHDGEPWISRDTQYYAWMGVPADYKRHYESKVENCLFLDGHVKMRNTHWPDIENGMNWYVSPYNWQWH